MGNLYVTPAELKSYLGITAATDDALLLALCERVSRMIDSPAVCDTFFYEKTETRYYDWDSYWKCYLDAPLLSCATLTVDDSAVDSDDYRLMPRNEYPKQWIEMIAGTGAWFSYSSTKQDAISVAGLWGYHDDYNSRWATDTTLSAAIASTTATTCSITADTNAQAGQTWKLDSEQVYVSALSATTATIERGVNGTTAATHLISAPVYIWRPMPVIREAARELCAQSYKMKDSLPWGRIEYVDVGTIQMTAGIPELVSRLTRQFRGLKV